MKKKLYKINLLLEIIFFLLLIIFFLKILSLKMLPLKYLILIFILVLILVLFLVFLNKTKSKLIQSFLSIILLFLIIILFLGYYYLGNTLNFMENISAKNYQIEEYYILVRMDSEYQKIEDLQEKSVAIFSSQAGNYQRVWNQLKEENSFQEISYSNSWEAYLALLDGQVESLFISFIEKEILSDQTDFSSKTRIIKTNQEKTSLDTKVITKDITEKSFNIFISGIDTYGNITNVSRSDVNMIATINPTTHQILLTSIPRDYYVQLHGTTGYKDKLTHAGLYGINMSVETLEDLLNIEIDYYIRVNFTTVESLVEELGGVDVYVDSNFRAWTNRQCTYQIGMMHLDGKCALAYARERYAYQGGDRHRVQNQQDIVKAIINKVLSMETLLTKYTSLLNTIQENFETNIPEEKIYQLIHIQLESMPSWNISQISLDGFDSSNYTYSYPSQKLYVMEPDLTTVTTVQTKIKELEQSS